MKRALITAAVAATLTLAGLGAPEYAYAGPRDHGYRDGGHHYKQGRGHNYRGYKRDRGHNYRGHNYRGHRYRHRKDNDGAALALGLIFGAVLGHAIASDRPPRANERPSAVMEPAPADYAYRGTCLQEREYQTTVIVGGKRVPAYGSACLQPDGSWRRSPARLAEQF